MKSFKKNSLKLDEPKTIIKIRNLTKFKKKPKISKFIIVFIQFTACRRILFAKNKSILLIVKIS